MRYKISTAYYYGLSFLLIVLMYPFFIWPHLRPALLASSTTFILLVFLVSKITEARFFLFIYVFFSIFTYRHLQGASISGATLLALTTASLILLNKDQLLSLFKVFVRLYAFLLLPGIVIWALHVLTGDFSIFKIGELTGSNVLDMNKANNGNHYSIFPFSTRIEPIYTPGFYRFQGFLDEPGLLGTFSALILTANQFSLKKNHQKIILVSGLISFSFAFYVLSVIYFILNLTSKSNYSNKVRTIFFLGSLIALIYYFIPDVLYDTIVRRFTLVDGSIAGDNRATDSLNKAFLHWLSAPSLHEFLFGIEYTSDGSASWKQIPVNAGAIGTILLFSVYFFYTLSFHFSTLNNYQFITFILTFVASIYQRPGIDGVIYFFIFLAGMALHSRQAMQKSMRTQTNNTPKV